MGNYIAQADIQARMAAVDFNRAFDRDATNNAATIATNVQQAINEAVSWVNMTLGEAFGPTVALDANGWIVDEAVKGCVSDLAVYFAVRRSPLATDSSSSPYRVAYTDAVYFFEQLRKDNGKRLQTSKAGPAQPRANVSNVLQSDGVTYSSPFNRVQDGKDQSGF